MSGEKGERKGLERAAQWHEAEAAKWEENRVASSKMVKRLDNGALFKEKRDEHLGYAAAIRAIKPKKARTA